MNTDKKPVDLSAISSDELIDLYIGFLMKQAEDMRAGEVDHPHATLLALLHIARSLDQMEFRGFHAVKALESISKSLKHE